LAKSIAKGDNYGRQSLGGGAAGEIRAWARGSMRARVAANLKGRHDESVVPAH
jgi:hypothetical protein